MSGALVKLNNWVNDFASTIGVGVYHSGIEIRRMIKEMGDEYRGDRYHLITKNCNHFSAILAKTLTGQEIPAYINRLASISNSIPFLDRWLPQEWLSPIIIEQNTEIKTVVNEQNGSTVERAVEVVEEFPVNNEKNCFIKENLIPQSQKEQCISSGANNSTNSTTTWTSKWFSSRRNSGLVTTNPINNATLSSRSTYNGNIKTSANNDVNITCNPSPTLTRLWNSIKSLGSDDTNAGTSAKKEQC